MAVAGGIGRWSGLASAMGRADPSGGDGGYEETLRRVETYFDRSAAAAWARLTSDAPVSRIRRTVRRGRDRMRDIILSRLPDDLGGCRILDAGCGAGQLSVALAARGADVIGADVSAALLRVARERLPGGLAGSVTFREGDMLDPDLGRFDHVVAMDSLIYYATEDLCTALAGLSDRTEGRIVFTVAPRTPLLMAMWGAGRLFPRADRSPVMVPQDPRRLARSLRRAGCVRDMAPVERVVSGFYISHCMEVRA